MKGGAACYQLYNLFFYRLQFILPKPEYPQYPFKKSKNKKKCFVLVENIIKSNIW